MFSYCLLKLRPLPPMCLDWGCKLPKGVTCSSTRKFSDTNSPPQFSRLKRLLKLWLTKGEIFFRSWVRTLVARSDWWASLKVVSISSRPWWARTALANPSGPSRRSTSRKPTGGSPAGRSGCKEEKCVTGDFWKGPVLLLWLYKNSVGNRAWERKHRAKYAVSWRSTASLG